MWDISIIIHMYVMNAYNYISKLAYIFEKLSDYTMPEITVVGDPKAPQQPVQQTTQYSNAPITSAGKPNPQWKAYLAYVEKDPIRSKSAGLVELPGWGYVLPQEVPEIQARLAKGWKRAGGYGLVPPEWYEYLTKRQLV